MGFSSYRYEGGKFSDLSITSDSTIVSNYGGFDEDYDLMEFVTQWFDDNGFAHDFEYRVNSDESLTVYAIP